MIVYAMKWGSGEMRLEADSDGLIHSVVFQPAEKETELSFDVENWDAVEDFISKMRAL